MIPQSISQKKLLAVEGKDDVEFFEALLKDMKIGECEIREVGGKDQFKNKIPALVKVPGFSNVQRLGIIRDADKNPSAAFDSIVNILKKEKLNGKSLVGPKKINQFGRGIIKIGIYLMPGKSQLGMLEDLCLKTVENQPAMKCVDFFVECASKLKKKPRNLSKTKVQTYLAAMPEIVNSLGIGAKKGYWNFGSSELNDLKSFLEKMK